MLTVRKRDLFEYEPDASRIMRGIMVGLALVTPIWGLLIATFVRSCGPPA